jgi:hypothetical protein
MMTVALGMAPDPSPEDDLPSDIAFRFFLESIDPERVLQEHARGLRHPERGYYEGIINRRRKQQRAAGRYT